MIRQIPAHLSLALLLLCVPPTSALAGDGDGEAANSIISECGGPDLPASAIDSCLERARVVDETDPSPELQSLEARLEARESRPVNRGQQKREAAAPALDSGTGNETRGYDSVEPQPEPGLQPDAAEPAPDRPAYRNSPARTVNAAPDSTQTHGDRVTEDRPTDPDADDEPPIADPPDSDASRDPSGEDSAPPSDDPQ